MKPSLLVVAHGSRRQESNDEVRVLTQDMRDIGNSRFATIECAFLELAAPSIPEGLEQLIYAGATQITVLPYFLTAGRHVAEDIPALIDNIKRIHPDIDITLAPYLGTSPALSNLMLEICHAVPHSH